jgi:chitinase
VWPSLGGWSLSDAFSQLARSQANRQRFAENCALLVEEYGFGGIDIDWEYPGFEEHSGKPDDKSNFNLLLDDVRAALDNLTLKTGKRYGLTAALPCTLFSSFIECYEIYSDTLLLYLRRPKPHSQY